ncbi:CDF family Co(II)/Ni(II) efflux transporter DmeF [Georhizobium sp. MAB10]|uniref:CDF family Co(II)/Ni(II) efflux transporter DmeF n=1 Tax=Georhizobium sp. MAB10 TaxID=3028319 RepID=UPI0038557BE9
MMAGQSQLDGDHDYDHGHVFLGDNHARNEKRVWLVIALTASMMVIEIVGGAIYGSMALMADGWHMATHAAALMISAVAYLYARRHARDRRFTFGTGKLGDLAGFASAVVLGIVALLIGWESLLRLANPVPISFNQAILVAVIGLAVNLISAWLLREDHGHHHHHGHSHGHDHDHGHGHVHGQDNNLRAAYLHVLADALTSVLAIVALVVGSFNGWVWADPLMGVVGALVIARWSIGLMRQSGGVLLDAVPEDGQLAGAIRSALSGEGGTITDLHVWQVGPGHHAAIIALASPQPMAPSHYKALLADIRQLSHVTVEVQPAR